MRELIKNWFAEEVTSIAPITKGASSRTFAVHVGGKAYILRGLLAQCHAEQEYAISQAIAGAGIGATVLPTRDGKGYVLFGEKYYNLQTFLPGIAPKLSEINQIRTAGVAAAKMHLALKDCTYPFADFDRFSTLQLYAQAAESALPEDLFPKNADTAEKRQAVLAALEARLSKNQIIHGDLGDWNMLWDEPEMRIIDFGECRTGDRHFDLAAIVCSILAKCGSREAFAERQDILLNAYKDCGGDVEPHKLHIAVYLWLLRGVLATASMISEADMREKACRRFMAEIRRYEDYTGVSFDSLRKD